jgi:hypothetical protein
MMRTDDGADADADADDDADNDDAIADNGGQWRTIGKANKEKLSDIFRYAGRYCGALWRGDNGATMTGRQWRDDNGIFVNFCAHNAMRLCFSDITA